ncbi:DUF6603 domain-containing protein [Streptomyces sp. NPDC051577]|uniref:DUF6603 domain-containing protein n=1 Tax=Streptomyces sp. NPDC051577 TaxID=3155166 RepID=UPI0034320F59
MVFTITDLERHIPDNGGDFVLSADDLRSHGWHEAKNLVERHLPDGELRVTNVRRRDLTLTGVMTWPGGGSHAPVQVRVCFAAEGDAVAAMAIEYPLDPDWLVHTQALHEALDSRGPELAEGRIVLSAQAVSWPEDWRFRPGVSVLASDSVDSRRRMVISVEEPPAYMLSLVRDAKNKNTVVALEARWNIRSSNLPVIGKYITSGDAVSFGPLRFVVASNEELTKNNIYALTDGILSEVPGRLAVLHPKRPYVALYYTVDGNQRELIGIGSGSASDSSESRQAVPAPDDDMPKPDKDLNMSGPLWKVDKFSLSVDRGWNAILSVDAGLRAGPLDFSLLGLRAKGNIWKPGLEFGLDGVSCNYDSDAFKIGIYGARVRDAAYAERLDLAGQLFIKGLVSFAAGCCYAEKREGVKAFYGLAQARTKIAATPPFSVTGILLGGGTNSAVKLPSVHNVTDFPLVKGIAENVRSAPVRSAQDVINMINAMAGFQPGRSWVSAGINFEVCSFINGSAALLGEWGNDSFLVALLGSAQVYFPLSSTTTKSNAIAYANLGLIGSYDSKSGALLMAASLSRDSYLIHPEFAISGGFVLGVWTRAESRDVVLSLGGYHPLYQKPAHYPDVPRIAASFRYGKDIAIRGQVYEAVTSSAFMAGMEIEITAEKGMLKAWMHAYAHVLASWDPFALLAKIGVTAGVSFSYKVLWWWVHINLELGVDVTLWHKPFGGTFTIHLWCVSASFDFGEKPDPAQSRLPWQDFRGKLSAPTATAVDGTELPQAASNTNDGALIRRQHHDDVDGYSGNGFSVRLTLSAPANRIRLNGAQVPVQAPVLNSRQTGHCDITSTAKVTVKRTDGATDTSAWQCSPVASAAPRAYWGIGQPVLDESSTVPGTITALDISIPPPRTRGGVGPAPGHALGSDPLTGDWHMPLAAREGPSGNAPHTDADAVRTIADTLNSAAQIEARRQLWTDLQAVGVASDRIDDSLPAFASQAAFFLDDAPLIG